jgi:hypothetical protein
LKSTATSSTQHAVKTMNVEQKKCVDLAVFAGSKTITQIAKAIESSRKCVRGQKAIVASAIDAAFHPEPTPDKVLLHLPATQQWTEQLALSLLLIRVSYRHVSMLLADVLDYTISIATENNIYNTAVKKVQQIHTTEDLSEIHVTANDELFHQNKPILSAIDTRSLSCYLLSAEDRRDEDTRAIHFMDCQNKGLKPERTIPDDAKGLV